MTINNIVDIKRNNIRKIIKAIRFSDSMTKKDVMEKMELSFSTVSNLCRELRDAGILDEVKYSSPEMSVGRAPMILKLRYQAFHIISVDLHDKGICRFAIMNLRDEITARAQFCYESSTALPAFVELLYQSIQACYQQNGFDFEATVGLAVSVPAIFDQHTCRTVSSTIPMLEGAPLKTELEAVFSLPVYIGNETNISVIASRSYEDSKHFRNIVYLFGSYGIGIGVISGGQLITGARGYATEICHIPIGSSDLRCSLCGNTGCIESDLSISGFLHKYQARTGEALVWDEWVERVRANDPHALEIVQENGILAGKLASILVNLFDPDIVYFGGEVAQVFGEMESHILEHIKSRAIVSGTNHVRVLADRHPDALLHGCSEQIFQEIDFTRLLRFHSAS